MWTLSQIIGMGMLSVLSIVDIQFRKVPVEILAAANLAVLVYQIMFQREDLWLVLGGVAVGIVFLGISWASRQKVGYGDSWAILILGIFLGLWGVLEVLAAAFLLADPGFGGAAGKKENVKTSERTPFDSVAGGRIPDQRMGRRICMSRERKKKRNDGEDICMQCYRGDVGTGTARIVFDHELYSGDFLFHDKNILSAAAY